MSTTSSYDVIVMGSGAAGLASALAASRGGAKVLVLERAPVVGGTTAVSGGGLWIPGARVLLEAGIDTPRDVIRRYVLALGGDGASAEAVDAYLDAGPGVLDEIEKCTPIEWQAANYPDYHTDVAGGAARGHCVETAMLDGRAILGDRLDEVRVSPYYPGPMSLAEVQAAGGMAAFARDADRVALRKRAADGMVGMGRALAAGLYAGCVDAGIDVERGVRVVKPLLEADHRIGGVITDDGRSVSSRAVIVASGGFEWDESRQHDLLPGPTLYPSSPPYNTGDGLALGLSAGAAPSGTQEAWWYPVVELPDDNWPEGPPIRRLCFGERSNPHSIMVNASGARFCNESSSYHAVGRQFVDQHPSGVGWRNVPAWVVLDSQHRRRYQIQRLSPHHDDPSWLQPAATLTELAAREGIDEAGLIATVERFNVNVRAGHDPDFRRGESDHDRLIGDRDAPHPSLGTVEEPPFYALRILPGTIGTKGGLKIDAASRALDPWGEPVPGLFAAGNAAVNPTAAGYPGAGGTLGPATITGWAAGTSATS